MDKTPPVNKNQKSNTECCKDYKQKKKLNDMMQVLGRRKEWELMLIGQRRKKINLRQKKWINMKKRDLENRNTDLKKDVK